MTIIVIVLVMILFIALTVLNLFLSYELPVIRRWYTRQRWRRDCRKHGHARESYTEVSADSGGNCWYVTRCVHCRREIDRAPMFKPRASL